MITADVVRTFLVVDAVGLALLALVYLWQRRMSRTMLARWVAAAVFVPFLGPFIVIANRPGEWNPDFSITGDLRRLWALFHRLLPTPPDKSMTHLDLVRQRRARRNKK